VGRATAQQPLRILLCEDHPLFRRGIEMLLHLKPDLTVVDSGGSAEEALALGNILTPDLVITDLIRPGGLDGPHAVAAFVEAWPTAHVLVVSGGADGHTRTVPCPPELTRLLPAHLAGFAPARTDACSGESKVGSCQASPTGGYGTRPGRRLCRLRTKTGKIRRFPWWQGCLGARKALCKQDAEPW
jgi:CheY-like chemotaxis protein